MQLLGMAKRLPQQPPQALSRSAGMAVGVAWDEVAWEESERTHSPAFGVFRVG